MPTSQFSQLSLFTLLVVPGRHAVHAVALPVERKPSKQATGPELVDGHWKPAAHGVHAVLLSPTAIDPGVHATGPAVVTAHADPAGQSVHAVALPSAY